MNKCEKKVLEIFFSTIWKQKMTNEIKLQYWGHKNELTLIPPFLLSLDQTPKSEELRNAVALLRDGATRLREQCRTDTSEAQTEYRTKTQQVIQCAYDIAKAAKQLVTMFEWLSRNDDAPCYVWMIWYSAILEWIGRMHSPPLLNDSAEMMTRNVMFEWFDILLYLNESAELILRHYWMTAVLKLHHFSCGNSISNICKKIQKYTQVRFRYDQIYIFL